MTKTRTVTVVASLVLLMGASIWLFSSPAKTSHEIVIAPVQGAQR